MNYWGYRIDSKHKRFFFEEIKQGRLRQGWGYLESQNLTLGDDMDPSAKRNLPIYNKVKEGDYLLIPHIESWEDITIVQATKDFNDKEGYSFSISEYNDYGHIFPVRFIKSFSRQNDHVGGSIRETFKCRSRFWNINRCEDDIKILLEMTEDLTTGSTYEERFKKNVEDVFDEDSFASSVYDKINQFTQGPEWEFVLCEGLKKILPEGYSIQTTSNRVENNHGADILIRIPGILDTSYVIAMQVKDYSEKIDESVIDQICKADNYFGKNEGEKLIDKYLIIIKSSKELNMELKKKAEKNNVKILFDKEVKELLTKMAKVFLGETARE